MFVILGEYLAKQNGNPEPTRKRNVFLLFGFAYKIFKLKAILTRKLYLMGMLMHVYIKILI